jgi:hypothetical protein
MNITSLLIQLVSGLVGGNAGGALLKNLSLGPVGNSIIGLIGGGLGGQLLHMLMSSGAANTAAAAGGLDMGSLVGNLAGGGIGGAALTVIAGLIKSKMSQS